MKPNNNYKQLLAMVEKPADGGEEGEAKQMEEEAGMGQAAIANSVFTK